ncbi:cysteine proteinase, partial [Gymnopus androsaceus JB14]
FLFRLWLNELAAENLDLAGQIHIFNSFFYKKLNKKDLDEGYRSVQSWTSTVDIFDKKLIIVPINENMHWYLAIIYYPEYILVPPAQHGLPFDLNNNDHQYVYLTFLLVFILDSLGEEHPKVGTVLSKYLQAEAKDKKSVENPRQARYKNLTVPTQPNFCDCGIYLIHFAQVFV